MKNPINRSLLIAAAVMVTVPVGLAFSETDVRPPSRPDKAHTLPCAERNDVVRVLREGFGEHPVAHGLASTGVVAEVFSSTKGTWTIVATAPDGTSCMIGAGESWRTTLARDDTI